MHGCGCAACLSAADRHTHHPLPHDWFQVLCLHGVQHALQLSAAFKAEQLLQHQHVFFAHAHAFPIAARLGQVPQVPVVQRGMAMMRHCHRHCCCITMMTLNLLT